MELGTFLQNSRARQGLSTTTRIPGLQRLKTRLHELRREIGYYRSTPTSSSTPTLLRKLLPRQRGIRKLAQFAVSSCVGVPARPLSSATLLTPLESTFCPTSVIWIAALKSWIRDNSKRRNTFLERLGPRHSTVTKCCRM